MYIKQKISNLKTNVQYISLFKKGFRKHRPTKFLLVVKKKLIAEMKMKHYS